MSALCSDLTASSASTTAASVAPTISMSSSGIVVLTACAIPDTISARCGGEAGARGADGVERAVRGSDGEP
eukprot:7192382-Alexandrium_andersonii.AAC.1